MAVIGLIAGAVGSLVAPWAKWGIEKAKIRHEPREKFIRDLRREISLESFEIVDFKKSFYYSMLYPRLSKESVKIFEPTDFDFDDMDEIGNYIEKDLKVILLKELGRLEKEWKLI